jgi:hypothetical protein
MPTIDATWTVKSGVDTTAAHSSTPARPMVMPNSAVRMGSPMATSEPKAMSRITMAASRPNASVEGTPPPTKR